VVNEGFTGWNPDVREDRFAAAGLDEDADQNSVERSQRTRLTNTMEPEK
jgi:hypothetical protein